MSLEQGLAVLRANYHVTNIDENDKQVVVTLLSDLKLAEAAQISRLGWVVLGDKLVAFTKPAPDEGVGVTADLPPDVPQDGAMAAVICGSEPPPEAPPDQPDSTETN